MKEKMVTFAENQTFFDAKKNKINNNNNIYHDD